MTVKFAPLRPGHLKYIDPQDAQRQEHIALCSDAFANVLEEGTGLSAWVGNTCIGAAGVTPLYAHRYMAWAMIGKDAGPHMLAVVRKMRFVLASHPAPRIEMTVAADFTAGVRLAYALGMTLETPEPMRKFGAFGEDTYQFARIR